MTRQARADGRLVLALSGVLMVGASGCVLAAQPYSSREERRFPVTGAPDVTAATFDGAIQVQGWDKNEVLIEIERKGRSKEEADQIEVVTRQTGSRVEVEVVRPKRWSGWLGGWRASASLRISAPRKLALVARSGDGAIRADNLDGRIELRTGDGSIEASGLTGELAIHTGDGSVRLDRASGSADLSSGDGSMTLGGKFGALRVRTGDGSVSVRADAGTELTGDWTLTSGDGGIVLYLPEGLAADLDAHTGDGHISTEFPIQVQGRVGGHELRARLGAGGRQIRVRTGDGSIALRKS